MVNNGSEWIDHIKSLQLPRKIKILNVCGGHERTINQAGLRTAIPDTVELIPGPGCPVCICPEEDVYEAIQLALHEPVILVAFGDMLRVPVNVGKRQPRSLEQARAAGADVRPIASPTWGAELRILSMVRMVPVTTSTGERPGPGEQGKPCASAPPIAAIRIPNARSSSHRRSVDLYGPAMPNVG